MASLSFFDEDDGPSDGHTCEVCLPSTSMMAMTSDEPCDACGWYTATVTGSRFPPGFCATSWRYAKDRLDTLKLEFSQLTSDVVLECVRKAGEDDMDSIAAKVLLTAKLKLNMDTLGPTASKKQKVTHDLLPPATKQESKILCGGFCNKQEFDANEMKPCGSSECSTMLCSKCYECNPGKCNPSYKSEPCKSNGLCGTCTSGNWHMCDSCAIMEVCVNGINNDMCHPCFEANPWPSKCEGCHSNCPACDEGCLAEGVNEEQNKEMLLCYSCYLDFTMDGCEGWVFKNM